MWIDHSGPKKAYYIKEFNSNCDHSEKTYSGAAIKEKTRLLVAQVRVHITLDVRLVSGGYPRKFGRRELAYYCYGMVETEHFVMECAVSMKSA